MARTTWAGTGNWGDGGKDWTGDFYVEMAQHLERACFDYVIMEDKLMVSTAYGGTMQADLKHGVNPKHDPVPLAVLMAQATSRLGRVCANSKAARSASPCSSRAWSTAISPQPDRATT